MKEGPWWNSEPLEALNSEQWEQLCDGCGKCCLHKLEDEDSGDLLFTVVACHQLDCHSCQCQSYDNRLDLVPDCVDVRAHDLDQLTYMPSTCAYRLRFEGKPLPKWHPLETGLRSSVHEAQMSVRGRAISETEVDSDDWDLYIVDNL